jgi:hypothetical protein
MDVDQHELNRLGDLMAKAAGIEVFIDSDGSVWHPGGMAAFRPTTDANDRDAVVVALRKRGILAVQSPLEHESEGFLASLYRHRRDSPFSAQTASTPGLALALAIEAAGIGGTQCQ